MATTQPRERGVTLLPLGTGRGATSVYDGDPSSAFALMVDGRCTLLIDIGLGVVRQAIKHCGALPDTIYVSHNHTDHAGDLPVALVVEEKAGHKLRIVSAPEVERRLKEHRIHELYSTGKTADDLATWNTAPEGTRTPVDETFSLVTYQGRHSETSYGFVLYERDTPLLGFTADSGLDTAFYQTLSVAKTLVIDARSTSSAEHASFDEVASFAQTLRSKRVFVTGYGTSEQGPGSGLHALQIGVPVALTP